MGNKKQSEEIHRPNMNQIEVIGLLLDARGTITLFFDKFISIIKETK